MARRLCAAIAMMTAASLAGCVEPNASLRADAGVEPAARPVARPGVSPSGAKVALAGLAGAPAGVAAQFRASLSRALAGRDVAATEPAAAAYFIQGHLGAFPAEGGVAVAWVWDVFDARKQRLQRMEDRIVVKAVGPGSDPWQAVDERVLDSVANRSADDLAAFLSNTPEAVASAGAAARPATAQVVSRQPAQPPANALGYAALR